MLNQRRLGEFRYDVRQLFVDNQMDPDLASTFWPASSPKVRARHQGRQDFVREQQDAGIITKRVMDGLVYYLDRYTKYQSQQTASKPYSFRSTPRPL